MPNPHPTSSRQPHAASDETRRAFLHSDREDLLAVLTLRFGSVPESVQARIAACDDAATLERWILVAANVPDWVTFLHDLDAGPNAFRLVGASYEPTPTESATHTAPREALGTGEPCAPNGVRHQKEE